MIKVTTIGVVCENRTESPVYRMQKLGFNDCQVALHHLELCRSPILRLIRPRQS